MTFLKAPCQQRPCLNNGKCQLVDNAIGYNCSCTTNNAGNNCEYCKNIWTVLIQ